jgi:hypothetical protein
MVRVMLVGLSVVTGPAGTAWYRNETLEMDERQLGLLTAQYGEVFAVQGEPAAQEGVFVTGEAETPAPSKRKRG